MDNLDSTIFHALNTLAQAFRQGEESCVTIPVLTVNVLSFSPFGKAPRFLADRSLECMFPVPSPRGKRISSHLLGFDQLALHIANHKTFHEWY